MAEKISISLLVCTRNRGEALLRTLDSISRAFACASQISIELIVVDNGSTDDTALIFEKWQKYQTFPTKLVFEFQPGLAHARNIGLSFVSGNIIAMTDDDCCLHDDYLSRVLSVYDAIESEDVIIGGRINLGDPRDLSITIKTNPDSRTLPSHRMPAGFIMGANLTFPKSIINKVGSFDERFGAGAQFIAAEDTDFLFRAMKKGVTIKYDPSFCVDHFHGRRTLDEAIALSKGYCYGDGALYAKFLFKDLRIIKAIINDIKMVARDMIHPSVSSHGIRRFGLFKALHHARGFFAYLVSSRR